jgi:K+-sensing histidine kinase KdpD
MKQFCEDLLSAISHDLRSPLTNMYSLIELIECTPDPVKKSELLVSLRQMVQKQEEVINSIFNKVENLSVKE